MGKKRIVVDRRVMFYQTRQCTEMGKGITETLYWFYNLVLSHTCGRLCALRLYNSLRFYTTGWFYASTFLRPTLLLHHCAILRIYDATVRRLSVLFYTTVRLYASTLLRLSLLLHDWTILPIYDATVRQLSVLFYTPVRFYGSLYMVTAYWTEAQG